MTIDYSQPPSTWPADPFRILGVERGVSARDLKRAYAALVRRFRPEFSPEEFQRVREAYEAIQSKLQVRIQSDGISNVSHEFSAVFESAERTPSSPSESVETVELPTSTRAPRSPWDLACDGDLDQAYQQLNHVPASRSASGVGLLQRYWLLLTKPGLDVHRTPLDCLLEAVSRPNVPQHYFELFRRELGREPLKSLDESLSALFRANDHPAVTQIVAKTRWPTAGAFGRAEIISRDIDLLRPWLADYNPFLWVELRIAAAEAIAWSGPKNLTRADVLVREAERDSALSSDFEWKLLRFDHLREIHTGLRNLGWNRDRAVAEIRRVLQQTWASLSPPPDDTFDPLLKRLTRQPFQTLKTLTAISTTAPSVFGQLLEVLATRHREQYPRESQVDSRELEDVLVNFLNQNSRCEYAAFRERLLAFCVAELIDPATIHGRLAGTKALFRWNAPVFIRNAAADRPLHLLYLAYRLSPQGGPV